MLLAMLLAGSAIADPPPAPMIHPAVRPQDAQVEALKSEAVAQCPPDLKPTFIDSEMSYPGAPIVPRGVVGAMGVAVLDCLVRKDGHVAVCNQLWEKPEGHNLGVEAAKLSSHFVDAGRADKRDCVIAYWTGAGPLVAPPWPEPPRPRAPSVVTNPEWVRQPNGNDLATIYPEAALKAGMEGHSTMECTVTNDGALTACRIVSEAPDGQGFGGAELKLATKFRMRPTTVDGAPVAGAKVVIPMSWRLVVSPPQDPPPPIPAPLPH